MAYKQIDYRIAQRFQQIRSKLPQEKINFEEKYINKSLKKIAS